MQPTPLKALAAAICTLALSAPLAAQEEVRINGEVVERFNDLLVVDEGDRRLLVRPRGNSGERFQIGDDCCQLSRSILIRDAAGFPGLV